MPAIPVVSLEVDGFVNIDVTPEVLGTSPALTNSTAYLVLARGQSRNDANGILETLDVTVGGTVWGRMSADPPFPSPAYGAIGGVQLAAAFLLTSGTGDTIQFVGTDAAATGLASGCRAYALDVTLITENDGRWHEQTANSDTIVTTPSGASGWVTLGNPLVVTVPRTGNYLLLASTEAVIDPADTTGASEAAIRTTQDSVELSGSVHFAGSGFSGFRRLNTLGYVWGSVVALTAATEYTWAVEGNGIAGTGLVGYRRVRLHLIEVAQIEDDDVLDAVDSTGSTVVAGTTADSSATSTLVPPASRDYLFLSFFQGQFSAWPRAFFLVGAGPTQEPAVGFINAAVGTGIGATDDMTMNFGLHLETGVSASTALGLRYEGAAGGGNCTYGNNCAHTDAGDIHLLSLRLYTPDAPAAGNDAIFFGCNF